MKILIAILSLALAFGAGAADMTRGHTFSAGDQVTHTKLNNLVDLAVVNGAFLSGKSAVTNAADADLLLLYSAAESGLRRISVVDFLTRGAELITGRTEDTLPATGDFILTYDISAGDLRKATIANAFFNSTNLIGTRTNWPAPDLDTMFLAYDDGAWSKVTRSNIMNGLEALLYVTNYAGASAITNSDLLWLTSYDGTNAVNKQVNLAGMITNLAQTTLGEAAWVPTYTTNDTLAKVSLTMISNTIVQPAVTASAAREFTSGESNIVEGLTINVAHSLGGSRPEQVRAVLVCKTSNLGYAVGDEIEVAGAMVNSGNYANFQLGANTTNVFLVAAKVEGVYLLHKDDGSYTSLATGDLTNRWKAKIYATRTP